MKYDVEKPIWHFLYVYATALVAIIHTEINLPFVVKIGNIKTSKMSTTEECILEST